MNQYYIINYIDLIIKKGGYLNKKESIEKLINKIKIKNEKKEYIYAEDYLYFDILNKELDKVFFELKININKEPYLKIGVLHRLAEFLNKNNYELIGINYEITKDSLFSGTKIKLKIICSNTTEKFYYSFMLPDES